MKPPNRFMWGRAIQKSHGRLYSSFHSLKKGAEKEDPSMGLVLSLRSVAKMLDAGKGSSLCV